MNASLEKKVLVLLFNRFTNDSRVLKECTSLVTAGYKVELWASYAADLPEYEVINGFEVRRKFGKPAAVVINKQAHQNMQDSSHTGGHRHRPTGSLSRRLGWGTRSVLRSGALVLGRVAPKLHDAAKAAYIQLEEVVVKAAKGKYPAFNKLKANLAKRPSLPRWRTSATAPSAVLDFDFIHCNDLLPLPVAVAMKKRDPRIKIIYDSHEYQTESAGLLNNPTKKQQFEQLERDNIIHADQVITVGDSIAKEYQRLYGLRKVHVVRNCPSLCPPRPHNEYFREKFGLADHDLIFLYQGGLVKKVRGLEETLSCFVRLHAQGYGRHHVVFMGYGNMQADIEREASLHSNIHFHPAIAPERIPQVSSSADYGTIFAPNNCLSYFYSLPNKLFEYIVCGLPIVTTPLYDMRTLIQDEGIGYTTADFTEQSIYETVGSIDARPSQALRDRIQALHRDKYNWNIEERALLDIYRNA